MSEEDLIKLEKIRREKKNEYDKNYQRELRAKGKGWDRHIYVPCGHQDCEWIKEKLEEYRREVKDASDTDNDQT